ncbi:hypothetical protein RHMOL_Rhmol06G0171700 [Rhododendron molle]|uniref:Uncharacterized protein n=1 Tax=Rhododendron molle TaxID=49168 RepID=A0ACC0NDD8_RHOML|nr:hypothetical protein RHMOL_Rhmol06G0171700 [Rhododendron molle]
MRPWPPEVVAGSTGGGHGRIPSSKTPPPVATLRDRQGQARPEPRTKMAKGLIWATEDMARNRGQVLSLYRQLLRSLNFADFLLKFAA